jgi:2-phosphosulfolactate phosphatase
MQIDLQLIPIAPDPGFLSDRSVVVIDVLRATSVITHVLSLGALEVIPVSSVEEGFRLAKTFPQETTLLGGERGNRRIDGFDLGNSPREYTAERVKGKRLILSTTNGTKAFHLVSAAKEIFAASFFNIKAVARRCLEAGRDLLIFPSGDEGRFSIEDTLCGGMIIDLLIGEAKTIQLTDASLCGHALFKRYEKNLSEAFHLSHHGKELIDLGLKNELLFCSRLNTTEFVPIFRNGVIRI